MSGSRFLSKATGDDRITFHVTTRTSGSTTATGDVSITFPLQSLHPTINLITAGPARDFPVHFHLTELKLRWTASGRTQCRIDIRPWHISDISKEDVRVLPPTFEMNTPRDPRRESDLPPLIRKTESFNRAARRTWMRQLLRRQTNGSTHDDANTFTTCTRKSNQELGSIDPPRRNRTQVL